MPLFLSDEAFQRYSHDPFLIAAKADSYILNLTRQLETVKAQADAASITSEQTCALLEQKYLSLSADFAKLEAQNAQLSASLQQRLSELAEAQAEKHQLHLKAIGKDGDVERLSVEISDLHQSKRQLLDLLEQKDLEIGEKNATIKSYLDKIVNLTDDVALKDARLHDSEAELTRSHAMHARLSQEKELIERHNVWLNDELTAKVNSLIELRGSHTEFEAEMTAKLADVEKQFNECSRALKWNKERVRELEMKLTSVQEELCSSKDAAAANEEHFTAELSTVNKLVELYKESSEEWSKKAGELEGVIKALETHLSQVENNYKEKLEKEASARRDFEKETAVLKDKLEKCESEVEKARKANEFSLLPFSSFHSDSNADERWIGENETDACKEDSLMVVPKIPVGVSGTALAASLLRDGWSLAKMYEKYQEAVDALRHERLGRKQSQAILQRVLYEIEEKAEIIMDERVEHERMVEAYNLMNEKLQQSLSEHATLENTIRELRADLRRQERDNDVAQKEIIDLQKQVTVLLKECWDIQLRCGMTSEVCAIDYPTTTVGEMGDESEAEKVISERLLTFKDINALVEQNVQLRSLVRNLSKQNEERDAELREKFEMELQKHTDEATAKVAAVLKRSEEQGRMIESLHSSVAMYKRLYEEELKTRGSYSSPVEGVTDGKKELMLLFEGSQEASKKAREQAAERVRNLEEELSKARNEVISLRLERDKVALEANFSRERLDSFMKEFEHQRDEINGVLARNVEFSQLIVDYQKKLRESANSLQASEELSRKLSMEVSVLKHERDILMNSERRASDEVRSLLERVHRLQASLDTIQSTEEVREEARTMERRKQEEHLKRIEREWAEGKKELQEERDHVRSLTQDREQTIKNAMRQVKEVGKELADALRGLAAAEARAVTAEARCSVLEAKLKGSEQKNGEDGDPIASSNEVIVELQKAKEEREKLQEEAQANKDHMLQYKEIAQVNEAALKQIESAHEKFKAEADKLKKSLEAEALSLRQRVSELEQDVISKCIEAASAAAGKEEALSSAVMEINCLKEENSGKMSQIMEMEIVISSLKEDLEKEHQRWQVAQNNYERQVILQSETIQELTKASQALASLQDEASELRKLSDALKSENDMLKSTWETEKSILEKSHKEAEWKYTEINEQNKILHNRLEALHIKLAEKERTAGVSSEDASHLPGGDDLQNVINYLRRSKEIAETEISLLKQERLRLQSQLERALKASETAQSQLHAERANTRGIMFTDKEFKSLKLQVGEMNLLRESNMQLREENKHNFEECQKFREIAQKAKTEVKHLENLVSEKQIEVDAYKKDIEMQKIEKGQLECRISELLERSKNIDVEDYNHMKDDYQQTQVRLAEKETELEETKKLVSEKQERISKLEQELAKSHLERTETEKKLSDILQVEATLRSDIERQKRVVIILKKKNEHLTKEKQEWSQEKQSLYKQLEDARLNKKPTGETASEQAMKEKEKEKDTRIQMLEKILEKEREDLRKERDDHKKEKVRRLKNEKLVLDLMNKVQQGKKEVMDELEKHKQGRENHSETSGMSTSQLSSETGLDSQTAAYLHAVDKFEESAHSLLNDELGAHAIPAETTPPRDVPSGGQQGPAQAVITQLPSIGTAAAPQVKITEERVNRQSMAKQITEPRKTGRKLIRPKLEKSQESTADVEISAMEGSSTAGGKSGTSHDPQPQAEVILPQPTSARKRPASSVAPDHREESMLQQETNSEVAPQSSARKRQASSSASEMREESLIQQDFNSDAAPILKRPKGSESPQDGSKEQSSLPSVSPIGVPGVEELDDFTGDTINISTEEVVESIKDDEMDIGTEIVEEQKESLDGLDQCEPMNEHDASQKGLTEKPRESEVFDGVVKGGDVHDMQHFTIEAENEREEGELELDGTEQQEHGDTSNTIADLELGDSQDEPVTAAAIDEDAATDMGDAAENASLDVLNEDKNEGEPMEELPESPDKSSNNSDHKEGSDKSNNNNDQKEGLDKSNNNNDQNEGSDKSNNSDQSIADVQCSPQAAFGAREGSPNTVADCNVLKQASPSIMTESEEAGKPSTTIDLRSRAKENSMKRQAAMQSSMGRGRGRASSTNFKTTRGGRIGRGRGGRGQGSGDKGQG